MSEAAFCFVFFGVEQFALVLPRNNPQDEGM